MNEVKIRKVTLNDVQQLIDIYAPYVINTAISFEYEIPTVAEFTKRINMISEDYPYLVAELNNEIVAYAYASSFHPRAAYKWCAETTIYLKAEMQGKGIGKKLFKQLENMLKKQNIKNLNACIAFPNDNSIAFHEHMGFEKVAHFHQCGYKLDKWWDMIWMEKIIGDHNIEPDSIHKIIEIKDADL